MSGSAVGTCGWDLWSGPVVGTCGWDLWLFCFSWHCSAWLCFGCLACFACFALLDLLALRALLAVLVLLAMLALSALPAWFAWLQCYTSTSNRSRNNAGYAALQCPVCLCVEKPDSAQLIANWCKMIIFLAEHLDEPRGPSIRDDSPERILQHCTPAQAADQGQGYRCSGR